MRKLFLFPVVAIVLSLIVPNKLIAQIDLKLSSNHRFLVYNDGTPFFPNGQTCWEIPWDLDRNEVESYLQTLKDLKFNIIGINSFDWDQSRNSANRYGDQPFAMSGGKYDPTQPLVTAGNDPNDATQYDYWDHLEYIIDVAASKNIYVVLLPAWGSSRISCSSSSRIFDINNAYTYGQWIGERFRYKTNIIWMMGGDAVPEYNGVDYKPTYRKMAEGVADGVNGINNNDGNADYSTTLMSYHGPKWSHSSSYWFPNDAFMDFNSTQDQPIDQISRILNDWNLTPAKGTWLFEGGYELRSCSGGTYHEWQCRYQAYQTVFSGGFGHFYGHMSLWDFDSDWANHLNDPGLNQMQYVYDLMTSVTDQQFLTRVPNLNILDGNTGSVYNSEGVQSDKIVATQSADGSNLMVYSANGSNIRLKMEQLPGPLMDARWFDPRTGNWSSAGTNIPSGSGAPIREFDPPGSPADENDWVLVLDQKINNSEFVSQVLPNPAIVPVSSTINVALTFVNTGTSTWSSSSNYSLGSLNPQDNTTWGTNRIALPHDVAPGDTVTITAALTAPSTPGQYNFQWQMLEDGVEWFGDSSNNVSVIVSDGAVNYSNFISQLYPTLVLPNDSFYVELTFKNEGTTTWQAGNNYRLGSQNPQDDTTWGSNRITLPYDVAPGDTVTITAILVAPSAEGYYNFQWKMVQDGVGWFGDLSTNVVVHVATINNSQFISQLYPPQIAPGDSFYVELTFRNIGNTVWSAGTNYKLGAQNPPNNTTWGTNRIALQNDVAPGDTVTLTAILVAPTTVGTYNFQWQMLIEAGIGWFGSTSNNVTINVDTINNSHFVSQLYPPQIAPGDSFYVELTFQNIGTTTWQAGNNYRLGSQNPQDDTTWGTNRIILPYDVAPGDTVTITAILVAPSTAGVYNFQWKMVQDDVEWFGEQSDNVTINVANINATQYISQNVPSQVVVGDSFNIEITYRNVGTTTWNDTNNYHLGSQNPQDNTTWGTNRIVLPHDVAPGDTVTITAAVTAPNTPGQYNFQWQMVQDGVEWFGDTTQNIAIEVVNPSYNILEIKEPIEINIFPNPNNGIFNLNIQTSSICGITTKLFDVTGTLVSRKLINKENTIFDLSKYPKGLYYLQITSSNFVKIKKIIIQ